MAWLEAVFERFTPPARQIVIHAQDEARRLGHDHIGGVHLLLGLLHNEDGLAARGLGVAGVDLEAARMHVVRSYGTGESPDTGQIPFTRHAVEALELAVSAADAMGHEIVGTEHVLLGLLDAGDEAVEDALIAAGATSERVRTSLLALLSGSA